MNYKSMGLLAGDNTRMLHWTWCHQGILLRLLAPLLRAIWMGIEFPSFSVMYYSSNGAEVWDCATPIGAYTCKTSHSCKYHSNQQFGQGEKKKIGIWSAGVGTSDTQLWTGKLSCLYPIQPHPNWPCKSRKPLKPIPSYLLLRFKALPEV